MTVIVQQIIPYALLLLIVGTIVVVVRLFQVLGDVRKMMGNVETTLVTTQKEVNTTLQRLESVAQSTELLMKEHIAPTLEVTRATLSNVEVTTRALADATTSVRHLALKAEALVSSKQLISAGGTAAQFVAKKGAGLASGLLGAAVSGVRSLIAHRQQAAAEQKRAALIEAKGRVIRPATATTNEVLVPETVEPVVVTPSRGKRK